MQIRDSQTQVLKYVQFGDLVRQQTQLLISVQQNQANVLKAFQDYQNMVIIIVDWRDFFGSGATSFPLFFVFPFSSFLFSFPSSFFLPHLLLSPS